MGTELDVVVEMWAKLYQDNDGEFQTDPDEAESHDQEWGSNSVMRFTNEDCGYQSIAKDFEEEERNPCIRCGSMTTLWCGEHIDTPLCGGCTCPKCKGEKR
jgi:hypothetical protein